MERLKPCPFCGSKNVKLVDSITNFFVYIKYVICCDCQCRGASKTVEEKAVEAWNTRSDDWISVKDRLPETIPSNAGTEYSEAVMVLTSGRKVLSAVYDGTIFICDADFWEAEGEKITHWKSALPLPKEDTDDRA